MSKELRIVGKCGKFSFDYNAEEPRHIPMYFLEYAVDDSEAVCGARYMVDFGHGYGFNHGTQDVTIKIGEEYQFEHEYTDTSDGTWDNDSYRVVVRLVEKSDI